MSFIKEHYIMLIRILFLFACLLDCLWTVTKFPLISNIHADYDLV